MRIGSKTFLLGEYLALQGGPSLVVSTLPTFEFHPREDGAGPSAEYAKKAGLGYVGASQPHPRAGGFGASTAEFLHLYLQTHPEKKWSNQQLLEEYWDCVKRCSGNLEPSRRPSGADLLAQSKGGIHYWEEETATSEVLEWEFPELQFTLLQTKTKVATHLHLSELKEKNFAFLRAPVEKGWLALREKNEELFIEAVNEFHGCLEKHDLVFSGTLDLINDLRKHEAVLAAKGCGALGADVVLVLHKGPWNPPKEILAKCDPVSGSSEILTQEELH